jgi:hypothetical protein
MKRIALYALLFTLAFAVSSAALRQDDHAIRLRVQSGQVDRYKVEIASDMKISGAGAGDQEFGLKGSMDTAYTFGETDATGKTDLEMKTTNIKMEASGAAEMMMGQQELPKEYSIMGKVDDRYRISEMKTAGLSAQTQMVMGMGGTGAMSMLFELPEKPVKIGDTWQVNMPKNPMMGDKEYPLTAKLLGIKEVDGVSAYDIEIGGKVDLDINMSEVLKKMQAAGGASGGADGGMMEMMAGFEIMMKGVMNVSGSAQVDQKSGRLLANSTKMATKQVMTIGGVGISVDVNGSTTVSMKLAK